MITPASADDMAALAAQLGRPPRGVAGVAWRCPCGRPGVAATAPRLPDGTPFPTLYYLTCPNAVAACSRLEASGVMASMTARLATDAELRDAYEAAHQAYLSDRAALAASLGVADVPRTDDSAGGMPTRVKCLHALVGHALAAGPGVNPFGDEALAAIGEFWVEPCLEGQADPATSLRSAQDDGDGGRSTDDGNGGRSAQDDGNGGRSTDDGNERKAAA